MTIGFDIEGAINIGLNNDDMKLRPYIGLELRSSSYGEIKEKKADSLNLIVSEGSYSRILPRFGVEINKRINRYRWYAGGEYKYLAEGELPEIENRFEGTDEKFSIIGTEEGKSVIGAKAGGSVIFAKNTSLYANINYFTAVNYSNFYANIGVVWTFNLKEKSDSKKYVETAAAKTMKQAKAEEKAQLKAEKTRKAAEQKSILKDREMTMRALELTRRQEEKAAAKARRQAKAEEKAQLKAEKIRKAAEQKSRLKDREATLWALELTRRQEKAAAKEERKADKKVLKEEETTALAIAEAKKLNEELQIAKLADIKAEEEEKKNTALR